MAAKAKRKAAQKKAPVKKAPAKKAAKNAAKPAAKSATLVGKAAPAFSMATDSGSIALKDLRGKAVVLYFYPKDDTTGCTAEACAFRDGAPAFKGLDAVVIGVSKDSVKSHQKFRDKYQLNFPLASDEDGKVCAAYGVWKEKSMYGRKFMGIERSTFLIGKDGKVHAEWRKVSVPGHADEVRQALRGL